MGMKFMFNAKELTEATANTKMLVLDGNEIKKMVLPGATRSLEKTTINAATKDDLNNAIADLQQYITTAVENEVKKQLEANMKTICKCEEKAEENTNETKSKKKILLENETTEVNSIVIEEPNVVEETPAKKSRKRKLNDEVTD